MASRLLSTQSSKSTPQRTVACRLLSTKSCVRSAIDTDWMRANAKNAVGWVPHCPLSVAMPHLDDYCSGMLLWGRSHRVSKRRGGARLLHTHHRHPPSLRPSRQRPSVMKIRKKKQENWRGGKMLMQQG